jgi:hypothetical protein
VLIKLVGEVAGEVVVRSNHRLGCRGGRGERAGKSGALVEALHTETAIDGVSEAGAPALPGKGSVDEEIGVRAEVAALPESEEALVLVVVETGDVGSDLQRSVGIGVEGPVGSQ